MINQVWRDWELAGLLILGALLLGLGDTALRSTMILTQARLSTINTFEPINDQD